MRGVATKRRYLEILEFTHFFEHFTFDKTDYSERGKHMKKYIRVVVAVELVTVGSKIEPIEFLGLWESLHNQDFKPLEFEGFRGEAGLHAFTMSPSKR